ncbi:hypothetical protein [Croceimicrobium hydrocarbonivorans]|uniref:Preprotein translocase subunit SecB n=1 Tax=Croceimicrobium hydrocarbonivorans TaxID=2761580 RepID=A0A7H0VA50_9FLAO|nr:hypothetical protein [Croceimicrobium hydrocarbonivorans]QNR22598.1 hypothetical protein H4K34_09370 [Croceimicrobium hydrocarbonivorans]
MSKEGVRLEYKVHKINTIKFSFEDLGESAFQDLKSIDESFEYSVGAGMKINLEQEEIVIDIETTFRTSKKGEVLIHHIGRTVFKVKGLELTKEEEKDMYDLPDDFIVQIYALAYSHARALLAVESGPTIYKDFFILPVVDPRSFIKNL